MKDRIIDAIGKIDDDMIESVDTIRYKEENNIKPVWVRWVAVAACFAFVAVFGIGGFQRGLFETKSETLAMENGESITFVKGNVPMPSLDMNMTSRAMNNEEISLLPICLSPQMFSLMQRRATLLALKGKSVMED